MNSETESSTISSSSRTTLERETECKSLKKSVSSGCNMDKEEGVTKSLWYWSNYYKAIIWQNRREVEFWKKYARALEYDKTCLLRELQRLKELCNRGNGIFKPSTLNQAYLEKPSQTETVEDESDGDEESESETEEDESDGDEESESETEEDESDGDEKTKSEMEEDESNEDEEIEFEMSEEMMKFFEQSMRHKLEMKKLKEKEREQFYQDVKDLKEANEMREKEMKLLYGEGSCMIIGMETAVQLSYDKYCDLKSPVYWPNIPLNL